MFFPSRLHIYYCLAAYSYRHFPPYPLKQLWTTLEKQLLMMTRGLPPTLCDPMVVECRLQESWHDFVVNSLRWLGEGYFFVPKQLGLLAKKKKKSVGKEGLLEDEGQIRRRVAADPNRVVPEPVQKEEEGFFFAFFFFFFFKKKKWHTPWFVKARPSIDTRKWRYENATADLRERDAPRIPPLAYVGSPSCPGFV